MIMPAYLYFFGIPLFKSMFLPLLPMWLTGYEPPLPEYGPESELQPAMVTWGYTLAKWAGWALLVGTMMMLMIWSKQEGILYVPSQPIQYVDQNPDRYRSPEERGMKYKEMKLRTKEGLNLQGWFMHQHDEPEKYSTIVFFHENAGNIGLRLDWFELMYKRIKVNIVCVAYRGYSRSEGETNQENFLADVDVIVEYCKNEKLINQDKVFLFGRSLGGAVAIHTLRKLEEKGEYYFKGAVIENTFTNISSMADAIFPMFRLIPWIKKAMLRLKWESDLQVPHIETPLFYISGD